MRSIAPQRFLDHSSATKRWFWAPLVLLVAVGTVLLVVFLQTRTGGLRTGGAGTNHGFVLEDEQRLFAKYAGSPSCRDCHKDEYALWEKSNHGLAERPVQSGLDTPAFLPARRFRHATQQTHVELSGTNFLVTCIGLSRSNETHKAQRVIGNVPLRQFLVPAAGGRLQVLEASYDPVSNEWFNVYGDENRQPGEWGHWTGRGMNWNSMCAACHNTRLRKNYDPAADTYRTAMAEPTVGCEACHGALKAHVEWQARFGNTGKRDPTAPRFSKSLVIDYCGFCHARRIDLTGDFRPGDLFTDHQDLATVDHTDIYYPDGQVRDENYEYAAFLSSRMYTNGVYCLDCHEPHSAKTRLAGNWLCMRCHNGTQTRAPLIEPVQHSHHKVHGLDTNGTVIEFDLTRYDPKTIVETGGECINCHMPQTVYMQRHWRHDHGFTSPDPLLTRQFRIPNACSRCHTDKSVDWAIEWADKWYGARLDRPARHRAESIAGARAGDPAAREPLLALLAGNDSPYWKAAAVQLLDQWIFEPRVRGAIINAAAHAHPLVRAKVAKALEPLSELDDPAAMAVLQRLLSDESRAVRLAAASVLRSDAKLGPSAAPEYRHFLEINSDQPGGQMMLGAIEFGAGRFENAFKHYATAAAWDPNSAPIRHELAVLLSRMGRTREAVEQLEIACRLEPKQAEFHFKLGLAWNEAGDLKNAAAALEQAVLLDPQHARAWYNLGLARHKLGRPDSAIEALVRAESVAASDPSVPYARATILAQLGRTQEARQAARRAVEIRPDFSPALDLLNELR